MNPEKITIEISREDAKWMEFLLGNTNILDVAARLSHAEGTYSSQRMSDAYNALRRIYYQFRVAIKDQRPNP